MSGEMSTTEAFDCLDPNGENGFVCPTCGQSYSRAEYLRRHQRKASFIPLGPTEVGLTLWSYIAHRNPTISMCRLLKNIRQEVGKLDVD